LKCPGEVFLEGFFFEFEERCLGSKIFDLFSKIPQMVLAGPFKYFKKRKKKRKENSPFGASTDNLHLII